MMWMLKWKPGYDEDFDVRESEERFWKENVLNE